MDGIEIKKRRKSLGLTQEKLAKLIGVTKKTIVNYEGGSVIPESKKDILLVVFKKTLFENESFINNKLTDASFKIIVRIFSSNGTSEYTKEEHLLYSPFLINSIENYISIFNNLPQIGLYIDDEDNVRGYKLTDIDFQPKSKIFVFLFKDE